MNRLHLFEFEDQAWFPALIRDGGTDFLRFASNRINQTAKFVPRIRELLEHSGQQRIIDLCSGGGGPIERIAQDLAELGQPVRVTLTDFFPNVDAFEYAHAETDGAVDFEARPIDAKHVPAELAGVRTLFNALHHFRPADARAILADARASRSPIAVVEMVSRHPLAVLVIPFNAFISLPLTTPFIRPFRWSRLLFTYLIPLIPLLVLWDGIVSCLRVYSPEELDGLVADLHGDDWVWETGLAEAAFGPVPLTYLLGYPKSD